ncbi:tetratricopeptide repeat protein, partial [Rhizobium sp. Leaf391]|uniref:tetratricopeptide repeat protein n=1 Tax=Rhizobium sp. Leaf391 TaxID=1736360 RepID=UPI00138F1B98
QGTAADVNKGLGILEAEASAGNADASQFLGDIYSNDDFIPHEAPKMLGFLEKGAAQNDIGSTLRLARLYRDGKIIKKNAKKSVELYNLAIKLGSDQAKLEFADGNIDGRFGKFSNVKKGIESLELLASNGGERAQVSLANRYIFGKGFKKAPLRGLTILSEESAKGNIIATKRLISLYRDGVDGAVAPSYAKANQYIGALQNKADRGGIAVEKFLLAARFARTAQEYELVSQNFYNLPIAYLDSAIRSLQWVNLNSYVYILQTEMNKRGFLKINPNGMLNSSTVKSFYEMCRINLDSTKCLSGPLSEENIRQVGIFFQKDLW